MEKQSKTIEQIYRDKYSHDLFKENPLYIFEAMGYLKALSQFMPSESWVTSEQMFLITVLKILQEKGAHIC